jgi:dTDP-4-dehydrorhamnose reductase
MDRNGHAAALQDLERFASLGIRAIRYPVLWERTAPDGIDKADWSWPDERLPPCSSLGVTPIVGLVHHGSGPRHTSLVDPAFPEKLAEYAGAVARATPGSSTTRRSTNPAPPPASPACTASGTRTARSDRDLRPRPAQPVPRHRAVDARDPRRQSGRQAGADRRPVKTYGTPRWPSREFLQRAPLAGLGPAVRHGRPEHHAVGLPARVRRRPKNCCGSSDNPCPPDIIGVNYYVTSERWLDHRVERYPESRRTTVPRHSPRRHRMPARAGHADPGIGPLLQETWDRYGLPIAITEAHIDANREDQLRWLLEIWKPPSKVRSRTAPTSAPSRSGRCSAPSTGTAWSPNAAATTSRARSTCAARSRARPRWRT